MIFGSGLAEALPHALVPCAGCRRRASSLRPLGLDLVGLQIAGPSLARGSSSAWPAATSRTPPSPSWRSPASTSGPIPALVGRVTYTGDLGYEIWVRPEHQRALFDLLVKTGDDLGIRPFGGRALNSLRLEKSFGSWSREYRPIYTPWEAGLERFVSTQKPDFIGRDAMLQAPAMPARAHRLATFVVDALDADVIGDEPIWRDGKVVGWVTSGGYAHASKASVALGYVEAERLRRGRRPTRSRSSASGVRPGSPPSRLFDPAGLRMRG